MCALAWVAVAPSSVTAANRSVPVDPVQVARDYVQRHSQDLGLAPSDIAELAVSSVVSSRDNGVTHVYLQQRFAGIEVDGGIINVNVLKDGGVISAGNRFVANIAADAEDQAVAQTAVEAAYAAAEHLSLVPTEPFQILARSDGPDQATTLSSGGIATGPIEAKLLWLPTSDTVRLVWRLVIEEIGGEHWWNAFLDAGTGSFLGQDDMVAHDTRDAIAAGIARPDGGNDGNDDDDDRGDDGRKGAAYRVFPLPMESPSDGPRRLVRDPANRQASPFGWHDTDGVRGPEFTITRGNNVHAYTDVDANNIPDAGSSPDGGTQLRFDFPLDLRQPPAKYQPAAVTNLFYWNNIMHDVVYRYGFDESAGNFQVNNYGRGGVGNDDVRAEAQDGSGRNNANFGTPVDGFRPRMQMFEWRSSAPNPITVHAPSPIAGTYFGPMAGFGASLGTTGPITGTVVLVNDGVPPTSDGCQPFTVPAGSIPLIDRGLCLFVIKVKNAQNAGAATAIVANNVPGAPFAMGGVDQTILIPSVMISQADGSLFKANLPLTATIADGTGGNPDRDSDLDSGVIAHEYTHGISNRLTGGPATVACLNNAEQMGEGWSDWFALALTARSSDRRTTPRGIGTYVIFQPPNGDGIRPTPYTTNMAVNPSTYASVADVAISQPHGIGYVWATMLWEMYWNLVDHHGFSRDIYKDWRAGGNNLAIQLVMDGMKFQPCRPGFVDGRNAILQADVALTGGKNACDIWRAFAKRGLGVDASQGSSNNRFDGVQNFNVPQSCLHDRDDDDDHDCDDDSAGGIGTLDDNDCDDDSGHDVAGTGATISAVTIRQVSVNGARIRETSPPR